MGETISQWPIVYIILLNWNGWQDTIECLESLEKATYPNFNVVIIDNASANDSVARIRAWIKERGIPLAEYKLESRKGQPVPVNTEEPKKTGLRRVELISSAENLGFCAGNNVGMEFAHRAGAEYFLILNNDTIVEPNFLEPLIEAAQSLPNVGLLGSAICFYNDREKVSWAGGKFNCFLEYKGCYDDDTLITDIANIGAYPTDCILGCSTLISRRVFEAVGGYDEDFFLWSEDWDLSVRIRKNGYQMIIVPSSVIYHKISKSLGLMHALPYYYSTRNRLLLKKKHLPWHLRMLFYLWFASTRLIRYSQFFLQGRFDLIHAGLCAIKDYFLGKSGKWNKQVG